MTSQSPKFQPRAGKGRSPKATICLEYNKTVNQDYSKFIDDMIEKKVQQAVRSLAIHLR